MFQPEEWSVIMELCTSLTLTTLWELAHKPKNDAYENSGASSCSMVYALHKMSFGKIVRDTVTLSGHNFAQFLEGHHASMSPSQEGHYHVTLRRTPHQQLTSLTGAVFLRRSFWRTSALARGTRPSNSSSSPPSTCPSKSSPFALAS